MTVASAFAQEPPRRSQNPHPQVPNPGSRIPSSSRPVQSRRVERPHAAAVRRDDDHVVPRLILQVGDLDGRKLRTEHLPVPSAIDGDERAEVGPGIQDVGIGWILAHDVHRSGRDVVDDAGKGPAEVSRLVEVGREVVVFAASLRDVHRSVRVLRRHDARDPFARRAGPRSLRTTACHRPR